MNPSSQIRDPLIDELEVLRRRVAELEQQISDRSSSSVQSSSNGSHPQPTARTHSQEFFSDLSLLSPIELQTALRAAQDQLQAILEAVPGIVSWISADLCYLGVNRHLAGTYCLPPEAFIGQDIGFLHSSTEFRDIMKAFFASPLKEDITEIAALVKGTVRNYMIAVRKYNHDQAALAVGIDITDRHQALEALCQAEEKYRSIFENAVEGIFQTTPDGHYISANPALARIYGYGTAEDLIGNLTSIQQQLYVDPFRRAEFVRLLQENDAVFDFESQVYRKDGKLIWISENARAVRDEQGQLLYYEGTVEDITERKRAQEALKRAKAELEQRVEERTWALKELNRRLVIEIAERQRVEAALRTSEAELRALFAAMTDVINVFDAQGRYLKTIATNHSLLYRPEVERVGKTVYDVLPLKLANLVLTHIQQALKTSTTVTLEYSLPISHLEGLDNDILADGLREQWFIANISPLPDGSVIWVARDITDRKRAEQALRRTEKKYRSIFENTIEGIFQTTPDGRHLSANPALVRMYGYSSEEELINHLTDIASQLYVDPQRRAAFVAALEKDDVVSNFESEIYRKDGTIIWTSENARAVRDESGNLLYYEGTVEDITKRKQAEAALRQSEAIARERSEQLASALAELQQAQARLVQSEKMSSLGQLVAGVAHEINNPVNFISGNLSYASSYMQTLVDVINAYQTCVPDPPVEVQELSQAVDLDFILHDLPKLMNSMKIGAERIFGIVRSLQNFSRVDQVEFKPADIHEGIDNSLLILQHRLKVPDFPTIEVKRDYGVLPPIQCFIGQLNQVFMNILSNAIDALQADSRWASSVAVPDVPPQISIKTMAIAPDRILISIADNGPGIDESVRQRVFDPFFTTKEVGKGTGLGLSISHQIIVEHHRGAIYCKSEPHTGAEFVIELPIETDEKA